MYLTSDEYNTLIHDAEDVSLLNKFTQFLTTQHQWKEEVVNQGDKDSDLEGGQPSPYSPAGIFHHFDFKQSFLAHFNCC